MMHVYELSFVKQGSIRSHCICIVEEMIRCVIEPKVEPVKYTAAGREHPFSQNKAHMGGKKAEP